MNIEQAPVAFRTTLTFDAAAEVDAIVNTLDRQVDLDEAIDPDFWRGTHMRLKQLASVLMSLHGGPMNGTLTEAADAIYGEGKWIASDIE
jgi:hypothetical protein